MRRTVVWLSLVALVAAQHVREVDDHAWLDEEYAEDDQVFERTRRDVQYDPYEEHVRVKRRDDEPVSRVRRSEDLVRHPRQVHQYEVHESTDEGSFPSPPYEEMLAASADHYHRVYAAPGVSARYLSPEVSSAPVPLTVYRQPVSSPSQYNPVSFTNAVPVPVSGRAAAVPHVVSSEPLRAPLARLAGEDQAPAAAHQQHSHGHQEAGGHKRLEHHHNEHGAKTTKGFDTAHHVDKGGKGHKTTDLHRKEYEEAQGKKKKHHDHAGHSGSHEEEAHGHRGAKFDEKKGHKKGHKTKGYHNKYHKDEFHKEHKFYDDYHKSGEHHRFGKFNAKHASNESGKKKAHHVNAGHDYVERGKKGYSNKGHLDSDHKGHKGKHGHEEHHQHHESHGKKGGKQGGKHWGYEKKN